ncbi:hypothetical protein HETIRDRAFT_101134 [Heterobasidion irregulare TC 32-1]|uniref:Homeobox domain-containing protein n=1 Tax=Heterobasidion irregulare (strain TC 32-1) TaxID=747525 RepID=W4KGW0_HETIT|nr:uncharacterized protein HETIRDRAFT_101134 [Heterobasidion irregulare TC 32-1]ETW85098.1 hypothetical protein HETIRDRAFT_101134 [Heterobasidion irregulare TC 32-1]
MAPLAHLGNRLTSHQIAELCEFWASEQGVPSLESRRAWSLAHQIDPSIVNKWFSRKKRSANKSKTMSNSVDKDNVLVSTHAMSNDILDEKLSADQPNSQRKPLLVDSTDEPSHIDLPLTQESLANDILPLLTLEGDSTCTTVPANTAVNSNTLTPPLFAYTPLSVLQEPEPASLPRDLDDFHDNLCLPSRIYLVSQEGEIYCDDGAISQPSSPYHPPLSSSPFVDDFPGWNDGYSSSNISDRHLPEEEIQEDRWLNLIEMADPEPFTSTSANLGLSFYNSTTTFQYPLDHRLDEGRFIKRISGIDYLSRIGCHDGDAAQYEEPEDIRHFIKSTWDAESGLDVQNTSSFLKMELDVDVEVDDTGCRRSIWDMLKVEHVEHVVEGHTEGNACDSGELGGDREGGSFSK